MSLRNPFYRPTVVPALVFALALALIGCATGVAPRESSLPLPPAYDVSGQAALPPAVLDTWWTVFQDPQLCALVELALTHAPDARLALARLEEAQAIRAQALVAFRPQGDLQANAERTRTKNLDGPGSESQHSASLSLPVSWELDLWGRRAVTRQAASADLAAARFNYEGARAALAAQVAQTLFQARGLAEQLEESRTNVRIQRELMRVLGIQADRGIAARSQVDRVAGELAQVEAQQRGLETELQVARRSLLVLVGNGFASLDAMPIDADLGNTPGIPATVPADLLARRPDVREARERIAAAAGNVRLAELDFYPRFTFRTSPGASVQGESDTMTGLWTVALGATVPILDRPRLQSALDITSARGRQSVAVFERTVQTAYAEADNALRRVRSDHAKIATLATGEQRSRSAFEAARVRFDRGLGGLQELLDAELAWRSTRSALLSARIDALQNSVQTFKALGGGWTHNPAAADPQN